MRVRVAHASLQFSDTNQQHTHDIEKIFKRAADRRVAWLTGTEAGPGSGNTGRELIRVARANGYRPWVPEHQADGVAEHTDAWIAVRKDLIKGNWEAGYDHAIPGSKHFESEGVDLDGKRWGPKGLVHVSFDSIQPLGRVSVGAGHYLTGGRERGNRYWKLNQDLSEKIEKWARKEGEGPALVFYGGDQNMLDQRNDAPQGDTFFGGPLTSTWDELKTWEKTHKNGPIDLIATFNKDKRVKALDTEAYDDKEFFLHGDHFYLEAVLKVSPVKN